MDIFMHLPYLCFVATFRLLATFISPFVSIFIFYLHIVVFFIYMYFKHMYYTLSHICYAFNKLVKKSNN